jgi:hypothetical protein
VNIETTDFAPTLVKSDGDFMGPFFSPLFPAAPLLFECEFEEVFLIWNCLRLLS